MDRRCTCRFGKQEGLKGHEDNCPMLLPPPPVERDPQRHAHPVAVVTGGSEEQVLYGRPATIDYNIEELNRITQQEIGTAVEDRVREFIGSVDGVPLPDKTATTLGRLMLANVRIVPPVLDEWILLMPEEQRLINDIKAAETVGDMRTAIDRFMASVYDQQIDALAAKRREHTKRLGH